MLRKKLAAFLAVAVVAVGVVGCGGGNEPASTTGNANTETPEETPDTPEETPEETPDTPEESGDAAPSGGTIKVGVINNDPNESGYRTANDRDMKEMFTEANGYEASFAYSLKNDEQITAAQTMIQNGVDYLLLSAADTAGWDSVLQDANDQGIRVILFDRVVDADENLYEAAIVSDMPAE